MPLDLSTPPNIPQNVFDKLKLLLAGGRLHRYGETANVGEEVSALEEEFAALLGKKYAVAMNSCGSTLFVSLKSVGVKVGDKVLMNAFTLAPVPGAIVHAGAEPVLVEITKDLTIDLDDLAYKAKVSGAKYLLLSHMRGHIADMQAVYAFCDASGIIMIEDCAHSLGGSWAGQASGTFGTTGCFSMQSYKHINAGEGGIMVTDDEDVAAKAILYSGSYMMYHTHRARPSLEVFERHKYHTPNFSLRLSNIAALLARSQISLLNERCEKWNASYRLISHGLAQIPTLYLPFRPQAEGYVQSSFQFITTKLEHKNIQHFLAKCAEKGVFLKWFGAKEPHGFTSQSRSWHYLENPYTAPKTQEILEGLFDFRLPLTLTAQDCTLIVETIRDALNAKEAAING
jgi:dTDP-4-amino-4,6-dideoxygalactose transaminase